ncbi:MAG: methyltransferase [Chlamydiia bacterium]|nr:methyltransferase [Chlamydiia bacterium]
MSYPDLLITSLDNPKVKRLLALREKRERDVTALFLIEGYREITRAIAGKVSIDELYICPELFLGENEPALIQQLRSQGTKIIECASKVFHKISYRDRPDGLVTVAKKMGYTLKNLEEKLKGTQSPLFIVAEAIEKPGNLGTILRSSDGAGAHGVIVCDRCTDIYNPNVVRASVGTLFTLPVIETTTQEALTWLLSHHINILAATPHTTKLYTDVDLKGAVAIAVGAEQIGLSKLWMDQAHFKVKIPMHGVADSLNVAMATTILLYETTRQRTL